MFLKKRWSLLLLKHRRQTAKFQFDEVIMASSKEYLEFVLEQCSSLSARAMMGEYVLYYGGKVVGGIYDNRLLVKLTK